MAPHTPLPAWRAHAPSSWVCARPGTAEAFLMWVLARLVLRRPSCGCAHVLVLGGLPLWVRARPGTQEAFLMGARTSRTQEAFLMWVCARPGLRRRGVVHGVEGGGGAALLLIPRPVPVPAPPWSEPEPELEVDLRAKKALGRAGEHLQHRGQLELACMCARERKCVCALVCTRAGSEGARGEAREGERGARGGGSACTRTRARGARACACTCPCSMYVHVHVHVRVVAEGMPDPGGGASRGDAHVRGRACRHGWMPDRNATAPPHALSLLGRSHCTRAQQPPVRRICAVQSARSCLSASIASCLPHLAQRQRLLERRGGRSGSSPP